jgi:transposase InsO family protein
MMRAESLLCQLQRSWVITTDSKHGLRTDPNLLAGLVLTEPNQAWVGDITSVRLPTCFIYLAWYASTAYIERLGEGGALVSMSAKGTPYDNAKAESFFKTLKRAEVYRNQYESFTDAEAQLGRFIDASTATRTGHRSAAYAGRSTPTMPWAA